MGPQLMIGTPWYRFHSYIVAAVMGVTIIPILSTANMVCFLHAHASMWSKHTLDDGNAECVHALKGLALPARSPLRAHVTYVPRLRQRQSFSCMCWCHRNQDWQNSYSYLIDVLFC
jgi:hypothetical protein